MTEPRAESPSTIYSSRRDASLAAAVHEFLHTVGEVNIAGQLLFDIQTRLFRLFAAALVDQHLLGDLVCLGLVLDEVDLAVLSLRNSVMASWMNLLVMAFLVWFS